MRRISKNCNKPMNKQVLEEKIAHINEILEESLPTKGPYNKKIADAMRHSVMAGGKRLRPLLMRESFLMFAPEGADETSLHAFMTAMEFIHSYSLVHDDLPCMDDAEYRRGKLTTHIKFGEAFGVLAGDALLNTAFEIIGCRMNHLYDATELQRCARAFYLLAAKAGVSGMVGGQALDVLSEQEADFEITQEMLYYIYSGKTAALIEASLMIGAILAGAMDSQVYMMEDIGKCVGFAFQVEDDILDVSSDEKTLGKNVGADAKNNKKTYVDFLGLEGAKQEAKNATDAALSAFDAIENAQNPFLRELIEYLVDRQY